MEAWASIFRHKRGHKRLETLVEAFGKVWYADQTFVQRGAKPKWITTPPETFLPQHLATELPSSHGTIPTRSISSDSISYNSTDDRDIDQAVDQYIQNIIDDMAIQEQQRAEDGTELAPDEEPAHNNDAQTIEEEPYISRFPNYMVYSYPNSSPRTTKQIEDTLQQEIDDLLTKTEMERHQLAEEQTAQDRLHTPLANEVTARTQQLPYTTDDLPEILRAARAQPNFPGLPALEVYAQVGQHLDGLNFQNWMANGRGYFYLGPRHPTYRDR